MQQKLKITFLALLATALALAIFFAIVKIAAVVSTILVVGVLIAIISAAVKFWPRK